MSEEYPKYLLLRKGPNGEPRYILEAVSAQDLHTDVSTDASTLLVNDDYWGYDISKAEAETYEAFGVARIYRFLDLVKVLTRKANRRDHAR